MATTLATQLRNLSVPSTNALKDDKKRSTLLFDPKEAATISGDVIYEIGLEGLEQLIIKNDIFKQFKNSLFNASSKNFDRNVHGKEDNSRINKNIKKFLVTLSPYVLTNSAHKALEWLFYRFAVNEFNKQDLILAALPYYDSNIFSRIVQILKFNEPSDPFYFLKSVQKSGTHLPRRDLFYQVLTNSSIIKLITKFLKELMKIHKNYGTLTTHFNFYCTVFCGAIEFADEVRESLLSQMLPLVLKGLSSPIADFAAASYVITAKLLAKGLLSDKLLNIFMEKVSKLTCKSLKLEATLTAVLTYQLQKQYEDLPDAALANFSSADWLMQCLEYLHSSGNCIYPFLKVLTQNAIHCGVYENQSSSRNLVMQIVNEIEFDESFTKTFLCTLLDAVNEETMDVAEINEWTHDIIKKLELKYSSSLILAINEVLKAQDNMPSRKAFLRTIFESTNESYTSKFQVLSNLYADDKKAWQVTLNSVAELVKGFESNDQFLLSNVLFERLHDKKPKIVERTLELLIRADIEETESLQSNLIALLRKAKLSVKKWDKCHFLAASLIVRNRQFNWKVFVCLFPYVILCCKRKFKDISVLFQLNFFADSKLFSNFNAADYKSPDQFISSFLSCLKNSDNQILDEFLNSLQDETSCVGRYSAMVILSHMLPRTFSLNCSSVDQVFKIFSISRKQRVAMEASTLRGYLKMALKEEIPLKGVFECLDKIIANAVDRKLNWTRVDLSQKSGNSFFTHVICSLAFSNKLLEHVLNAYLSSISSEPTIKFLVCLNICSSGVLNEPITSSILRHSCQILTGDTSVGLDQFTCFYLLVLFSNPNSEIRTLAFDLAGCLVERSNQSDAKYVWFVQQLLLYKEEVIVDEEQISLVCFNLLRPSKLGSGRGELILSDLLKAVCSGDVPMYVKAGLLKALSHINSFNMLEMLSEHLGPLFADKSDFEVYDSVILQNLIKRFDMSVISQISLNTDIWRFVTFVLNSKKTITVGSETFHLPNLLLNQFAKDADAILVEDVLEKLLDMICEVAVSSEEPEFITISSKMFKHMDLNAKLITSILVRMAEVQSNKASSSRSRRVQAPTIDILDTLAWKKGVCVLEFLQGKKKIRNGQLLLPLSFDILKKCLDFEEQAAVEYPKQLTLSLILLVCNKLEDKDIPEKDFNIELVIQCIRASQNPQTHYHALLALAHAARFVPNDVLHHVMAVFTFMGSTLIRHDDAYSFEIISKIVDTIVPILVSGSHTTTITDVLRVFADALLDVPEHRRIPLYSKLLNNIGTKDNFHLFLLLVLESEVFQTTREKRKTEKGATSQRIQIALVLCQGFSPDITLHACVLLAKYLNDLPDEKDEMVTLPAARSLINLSNYNAKHFRHFKYLIITFLSNLLSSRAFVNNVASLSDQESIDMEHLYKELIINVLAYIQRIQRVCDKAVNTPQSLYWKTVLYHSYDLLDSVNDLLTPRMFLLVIKGLLAHSINTVKKRALELLNNKLQYKLSSFNDQDKTELYILIKPILLIIETIEQDNLQSDQETLIQTALLSLKLIVKTLGPQDPERFVQILEFVASILNSGKARDNVLASLILCLAELCIVLRGHGISGLNSFMPVFLTILKKQKYQETSSMLLLSVITTVNKLLDSFAAFLSPYLKKLLCETSILISKWSCSSDDSKSQALTSRLNGVKKKISVVIAPRILIPTIEECYSTLISKKYYNALVALIDIMEEQLSSLQFADITPNMAELTSFFLKALQFRCDNSSKLKTANLVEDQVVKTITVFILKLSESTFRPFYLKLYDWAVRSGTNPERLITFYHLSESIGHALKGLFALFAGNILGNLSEILRTITNGTEENTLFEDPEKIILLLEYVLKTLQVVFTYDNKKLINRDRFELLMQPLVDLLEKDIDGLETLVKRNEKLITPTIVEFSLATADDSLWKEMNYQILLKMRSTHPQIRLVALHCLSEVVSKLREDFLPLLPETIPFLAELLEDEDERVERACQKTIREMEKMLGEPLQKYF